MNECLKDKLSKSLPLIITNNKCVLITEDNYNKYGTKDDIGKYYFPFNLTFTSSNTYPKEIEISNLCLITSLSQELVGYSIHASFNKDYAEFDHCIGFVSSRQKTTHWIITSHESYTLLWFKNLEYDIFSPHRFIIIGTYRFNQN